jgi:hypothetical protein
MTEHDDINPNEDAAEAFRGFAPKRRFLRVLTAESDELTDGHEKFMPDATVDDILFPGAQPELQLVHGLMGFKAQIVRVSESYQIYDVDSRGRWTSRVDEVAKQPAGTKWDSKRRGFYDPSGHAVSKLVYVDLLRRGDPILWSIRFQSGELKTFDAWLEQAQFLHTANGEALPFYGARWRWRLVKQEGRDEGSYYTNWAFDLIARFRDLSPEAPTKDEYLHAKAIFHGAAAAKNNGAGADQTASAPSAPPPKSADDYSELPDWMR